MAACPRGERPGEALERRVGRRLVLADGQRVQGRPEQPVHQHVARGAVEVAGLVHALFELDVRVHPELASRGRGDADEVRLHRPGDQHGVGAAGPRLAEMELELAHLVAPEREPRAVVALDPQLDAEGGAEARSRVERGRRVAEPDSREPVDGGDWVGHDGGGSVARRNRAFYGVRAKRVEPVGLAFL